jgi:hypothetical protein
VWNLHNKYLFSNNSVIASSNKPAATLIEKRARVKEWLTIHQLAERRVVCRIKGNRWRK